MQVTLRVLLAYFVLCGCAAYSSEVSSDTGLREWMREDVAFFREKFLAVDRSFTPAARVLAERKLLALEHASTQISPSAFVVELCRIAAIADNGHTKCVPTHVGLDICQQWVTIEGAGSTGCSFQRPDFEVPDFKTIPIAFYPFGDQFHVVAAKEDNADLLGARLVAVEGLSIESIRSTLRTFSGGTPARRDLTSGNVLSSPEQLHAVGLSRKTDSVQYNFVTSSGQSITRTLGISQSSSGPTRRLPDLDRAAWSFLERGQSFRLRDAPELNAVVVQLRLNLDVGDQKIADFLNDAEKQRSALGRKNVVLDMRDNGGGNLMLTREFMMKWPERVPGRFFVLTSRRTFSAGIASIAYLKQAGKDRVTIVGETVGDRLIFFSDGRPVQLPHSGRFFLTATVRMDYRTGCRAFDDCFQGIAQAGRTSAPLPAGITYIERLPISVDTLEPDVLAPWTVQSWLTGTDPAMEVLGGLASTK